MTKDDEARVLAMLDAFENGKRVADLDEVDPEKSVDAMIEVTDSDGESRRASLGTLLQATDAKGLLESLEDRVEPLEADLSARQAAASKTYAASRPERSIYSLMPDGNYANISVRAPVEWGESRVDECATLDAEGKLWETLWGGTCRIDNVENIKVGDYVLANNTSYRVTARPQKGYRNGDSSAYYYFEAGSVGFTSYPCGRTNEFIVVSAFDYQKSAQGRIGLVVRIPGLFRLGSQPYTRDVGLWMKDANSFVVVGGSDGRHELVRGLSKVFHKDPLPIWESPYEGSFPGGLDSPWFYRKSRAIAWGAPNSSKGIEGQETYEVVEGTTVGYPMNEDHSVYALWPCTYRRRYSGDDAVEPCRYNPILGETTTKGIRYIELPIIQTGRDCVPFVGREFTLGVDYLLPDMSFSGDISDLYNIFLTCVSFRDGLINLRDAFIIGQEVKFAAGDGQEAGVSLIIVDKDPDLWERIHPAIDHVWSENNGQYPDDGNPIHSANVSALVKYRGQILDGIVKLTLSYSSELLSVAPWDGLGLDRDNWSTTNNLPDFVAVMGSVNIMSANHIALSLMKDNTQPLTSSMRVLPQPSIRQILPSGSQGTPDVLWEWMLELYNGTFRWPNGTVGRLHEQDIWSLRPGDVLALREGSMYTRFVVTMPPYGDALYNSAEPWSPNNPREIVITGTFYTDLSPCTASCNVEIGFGSEDGYDWFISYVFVPSQGIVRYNDGGDSPNWRWE